MFYSIAIARAPGAALAFLVAATSFCLGGYIPIPTMVIALAIGMMLNPMSSRPAMTVGQTFCVKVILRWSIALLGLRVAISDIANLGTTAAVMIVSSMAMTVVSGFLFARLTRQPAGFGALIGVGTAVCGASATLATSTVVPDYENKHVDTVVVVVAVNALATLGMLAYPPLCALLQFGPTETGIMLGGTIHDIAQVAGAGYAVSSETGTVAVVVKLFRVLLLLPFVLAVGTYLSFSGAVGAKKADVPIPGFAIVFLVLCVINSVLSAFPDYAAVYSPIKSFLLNLSMWGLLMAISALGLGTSIGSIIRLGWRRTVSIVGTSMVILFLVTASILVTAHGL